MSKCIYTQEQYDKIIEERNELANENFKLKQQLAEKEEEIESLKASSDKNIDYLIEFASLIDNEKDCNRMLKALDRVKKGKKYIVDKEHQDKISFAVEQLETVKAKVEDYAKKQVEKWLHDFGFNGYQGEMDKHTIDEIVDQQIKELKEKE